MQTQTAPQAALRQPATATPFSPRAGAYDAPPTARAFGVGYGASSGYASARRYGRDQTMPLFRCG